MFLNNKQKIIFGKVLYWKNLTSKTGQTKTPNLMVNKMIFVSLGTHERPFFRLVKEIDRLSCEGLIKDRIFVQLGFTSYRFKSPLIRAEKYVEQKKFDMLFKGADAIITHGGSGNILEAISQGKPVVAVPRLSKFGEHVNDHQLQIVKEMEKSGNVFAVYGIERLLEAVKKAKAAGAKKVKRKTPEIFAIIEKALEKWDREMTKKTQLILIHPDRDMSSCFVF